MPEQSNLTCPKCESRFYRKPAEIARAKGPLYCSRECRAEFERGKTPEEVVRLADFARIMAGPPPSAGAPAHPDDRLAKIEQSLKDLSEQLDRISGIVRYIVDLLEDEDDDEDDEDDQPKKKRKKKTRTRRRSARTTPVPCIVESCNYVHDEPGSIVPDWASEFVCTPCMRKGLG